MGKDNELIGEALQNITEKEWTECVQHVIKIEEEYWKKDLAVDTPPEENTNLETYSETLDSDTDTASEGRWAMTATNTASEIEFAYSCKCFLFYMIILIKRLRKKNKKKTSK